jgi:hypothetical protein
MTLRTTIRKLNPALVAAALSVTLMTGVLAEEKERARQDEAPAANQEKTNPYESLKKNYQKSMARIEDNRDVAMAKINDGYVQFLGKLSTSHQKKGDLTTVIWLQGEKDRFKKKKDVPSEPESGAPEAAAKAQVLYAKKAHAESLKYERDLVGLSNSSAKRLNAVIKQLTSESRIDEALVVREAVKKVHADPAYLTARKNLKAQIAARPKPTPKEVGPPPIAPFISNAPPRTDRGGWKTLFDGKKLYGAIIDPELIESGAISVDDGVLRIDSIGLKFNLEGKDMVIRATAKKVSGTNLALSVRSTDEYSLASYFNGGNSFGLGGVPKNGKWTNITRGKSLKNFKDFFDMELSVVKDKLKLDVEGDTVLEAEDVFVRKSGHLGVSAYKGVALYKSIEAKILDK